MKWILLLAAFLACAGPSMAQAPRMTVRDRDGSLKLLQVEQADVSIRFLGDIAETVFDLQFRNDEHRAVEGEFVLPLPQGATVSGYALDVNGRMRDGVAVERERARIAYESVKRRMIDPGLVEREAGNVYRTRVFPVPGKGTKRLRISYRESLKFSSYALPLDFPAVLGSFSCQLSGDGIHVTEAAGLHFTPDETGSLRAQLKNAKPAGTLKLTVTVADGPRMILETGEQPAFFLSDRTPEIAARPRPAPATVMLVWDASGSRANSQATREFALLETWFERLGKTRVKLRLLRDRLEDGGEFEIRGGKWSKLKQALQQVDYDGATALSQMQVSAGDADLVVYVGDGVASLGYSLPAVAVPLVFVHSGQGVPSKGLVALASSSGGAVIESATDDKEQAMSKLTHQPVRLLAVRGADLREVVIDQTPGHLIRVFGALSESRPGKIELRYGFGDDVVTSREVIYQPGGGPSGIVRRLHAQWILAELEQQNPPDRKRIITHCKRHGLVSDFTSLIVLDRIEDYADHQIPPPEPELLAEYQRLVELRSKQRSEVLGGLASSWSAKLQWFGRRFPGYEVLIHPRLRQVGIWKKAVESQFEPGQRDAAAFATVAGWFEKATDLIGRKSDLRTKDDYQTWCRSIDELNAQGPHLAQTPPQAPPAGKELTVSVRGLVVKPGLVKGESGMTLLKAIDKAGVHPLGTLDYVALYRNAGKIVYNTLSEQFQDVPLFPGDMVVVAQPPFSMSEMDPFSDPSPPADPRKGAPVREHADLSIPESAEFGGVADPEPVTAGDVVIRGVADIESVPADLASFERAIADGADPESAYRKLRGTNSYQQFFYIEAARSLFAKQHTHLARRVLSNLVECQPDDISTLRAFAFWLAEFGQVKEAETLLSGVPCGARTKLLLDMDLASLRTQRGDPEAAFSGWYESMKDVGEAGAGELAAIAVTEFNALLHRPEHAGSASPLLWFDETYDRNLRVDIRIVLTSVDENDSPRLEVAEPGGFPCAAAGSLSPYGGRITDTSGVSEYMIRHAVPGVYRVSVTSRHPVTLRAAIHTRWGHLDQKSRFFTLGPEDKKVRPIGDVEIEFPTQERRPTRER